MPRPPFVVRSSEVLEEEGCYPPPFDAEKLSHGRDLGRAAGSRTVGAWRERLPPGRRTSFTHAHLREEELVYVLAGAPSVRWIEPGGPAQEYELAPGDLVAFPAGTGLAHTFVNRGDADAELLVVGERRGGERAFYPEDAAYQAWRAETLPDRTWTGGADPNARPPAARVETERLVLRLFEPTDAPDMVGLIRRDWAHLQAWMSNTRTIPTVDEQVARALARAPSGPSGDWAYGMFTPDGALLGAIALLDRVGRLGRELGGWIGSRHEGKGYVTEAAAALCRVAFDVLAVDRVEMHCAPDNKRSAALPARLGFTHEATLPRRGIGADGQPVDLMVWSLYRTSAAALPTVRAFDLVGRRLL